MTTRLCVSGHRFDFDTLACKMCGLSMEDYGDHGKLGCQRVLSSTAADTSRTRRLGPSRPNTTARWRG